MLFRHRVRSRKASCDLYRPKAPFRSPREADIRDAAPQRHGTASAAPLKPAIERKKSGLSRQPIGARTREFAALPRPAATAAKQLSKRAIVSHWTATFDLIAASCSTGRRGSVRSTRTGVLPVDLGGHYRSGLRRCPRSAITSVHPQSARSSLSPHAFTSSSRHQTSYPRLKSLPTAPPWTTSWSA